MFRESSETEVPEPLIHVARMKHFPRQIVQQLVMAFEAQFFECGAAAAAVVVAAAEPN